MSSSERKPFKINVSYEKDQDVIVYAESLEDALEIAREAAHSGELQDFAPEESMQGGKEPMEEITVDGGYSEGGQVKIMVGAVIEDVPHVSEASHA
ncbi:hypothetical protein SAMN04488503_2509 [Humidesulfovibrio mexicanus]|uniref:Uncharacterized protein n=1 Tax=Humidesulfovibrio mexicanus TaxID=147047 RepID=A0A239BFM1_9BACT|nr:hypothetical protein [Humidesulfovibrio mexicanus]SNS06148.1 hypothetical protein SAMN04488503_2509 [Humidesulfovibrio mexicanus]